MAEKTRYSDAELEEFRAIINEKLELAQRDYEQLKLSLMAQHADALQELTFQFRGRCHTSYSRYVPKQLASLE